MTVKCKTVFENVFNIIYIPLMGKPPLSQNLKWKSPGIRRDLKTMLSLFW